jgi:aspartate beta-hydroxylase
MLAQVPQSYFVADELPPTRDQIVAFLEELGCRSAAHAAGRSLMDHLVATGAILAAWKAPTHVQHAGMLHSVYGTAVYRQARMSVADGREPVRRLIGHRAERLVYLFSRIDRRVFWVNLEARRFAGGPEIASLDIPGVERLDRSDWFELALLLIANEAEQKCAPDQSPGQWVKRVVQWARLLNEDDGHVPAMLRELVADDGEAVLQQDEMVLADRYRRAVNALVDDAPAAVKLLQSLCSVAPWLAEPRVWLAYVARAVGQNELAGAYGRSARALLDRWGTAWDKRLAVSDWRALATGFEEDRRCAVAQPVLPFSICPQMTDTLAGMRRAAREYEEREKRGNARFLRYIGSFASAEPGLAHIYPDLPSRPWHDPRAFPVVAALEEHYEEILAEIQSIGAHGFHREAERSIARTGAWEVFMLYERGKRQSERCSLVPRTMAILERHDVIRTHAGLAYFSRMRPQTHVKAHRGPTNLRVRCHLPLIVPEGDCAIRVDRETRQWKRGECCVFDDYYEHEAWNRTNNERLILIVDLWNPALTGQEIRTLHTFQTRVLKQANNLNRYWSNNDEARRDVSQGEWR